MPYVLDTNVFIEAKDSYYMFDFCPAFWDWLTQQNGEGVVYSVQKVYEELEKGDDDLLEWAKKQEGFFLQPDSATEDALRVVASTMRDSSYDPATISEFLNTADYYLVAEAYARGYTVVTRETRSNSRNKIKIPNACAELQVTCTSPYDMLSAQKARFVLG